MYVFHSVESVFVLHSTFVCFLNSNDNNVDNEDGIVGDVSDDDSDNYNNESIVGDVSDDDSDNCNNEGDLEAEACLSYK